MPLAFPFYIPEPLSRALFVVALALVLFALFRYRQTLDGRTLRLRWLLIGLRGAALLLLACALAGVRVEYESAIPSSVLVRDTRASVNQVGTTNASSDEEQTRQGIVSELKRQSFAVVEQTETSAALTTTESVPFIAGVLLTSGAMRADEAALEVNRLSAATGGAPVYVLTSAQQLAGPRVALESVAMMGQSVRGVPTSVRCIVHGRGMRGRESLVTIADEAKVQASARVRWTRDDEWQTLTLDVVPKVAGWTGYTARIEAASDEDASLIARALSVYVEERRWRVLFFEGEPTWEAKFIRRALEQSNLFEVDYFAQVSKAAAVGAMEKAAGQDKGEADGQDAASDESKAATVNPPEAKLHAVLGSAERLNSYDSIIVGATPNEMLSNAEAARLSVWTERRGGGLIITGSNSFAGSIAAPNGKLYRLLPAAIDARGFSSEAQQVSRGVPLEAEKTREGLALLPTAAGASGALGGYLNAVQAAAATRVDVLTGQGMRLGALRPGASVLAVAGRGSVTTTSEAGTPLIAAARYGAGRTLLFAPADSWRLRTGASGEQDETNAPYNALWQGLLLWAAAGARPPVEITLSDESPAAGRDVTAELRVRDALFTPAKIEKLNARLQPLTDNADESLNEIANNSATPREVAFVPDENDGSVWRATLPALAPGKYALEAEYVAGGGKGGSASKQFAVVASHSIEPGAAHDALSRTARETGGGLLTGDEANALVQRIAVASFKRETVRRTWELRTWTPLAFIIPLLLSAAWFIERQTGSRKAEG